jgi:hypothetical protein
MAESDLIARKILGTDPQVGFGESSVLPYRKHSLDTTGFEALERSQARGQARKEARRKNNEDYYNLTIKNLPEYEREFDNGLRGWRDEIINDAYQLNRQGISPSPAFTQKVLSYTQAAKNTNQLKSDLNKIDSMPLSKFTNKESIKGAALKKYSELAERVNAGDKSAFNESIIPDVNDPEHFMFDAFLEERHGKRPDTVTSQDKISYTGRGERVLGEKVSAKFVTTDKNGKVVPGIDQSVVDQDLYSQTTEGDPLNQYLTALFSLADKQIMNKALDLKANDPRYKEMGTTQIMQSISSNPKDEHYSEFNRRKIAEGIHRDKLEAFQRVSNDSTIGALNEYNSGGSGDGSTDNFTIQPTIISQETGSGNPITSPGVILTKKDKPLVFPVASKTIHDLGDGKMTRNTDRVNVNATSLGYALKRKVDSDGTKKGTLVSFNTVDDMINYINTAKKSDLNKYELGQFLFGTIQEKKTVEGDTGEDEPGNKREQNVNRSVAIDYDPNGETGSLLNAFSDGAFNKRKLTQDEQRVIDAWENRMKKVEKKESKPKTVVQNGITYTYNSQTGEYE